MVLRPQSEFAFPSFYIDFWVLGLRTRIWDFGLRFVSFQYSEQEDESNCTPGSSVSVKSCDCGGAGSGWSVVVIGNRSNGLMLKVLVRVQLSI